MAVNQFRIAMTSDDYDAAIAFYRDGPGLDPGDVLSETGKGQMFPAAHAVLEIFDMSYARSVDEIEVGQKLSGQIRFAFQVDAVYTAFERALKYGATLVHETVLTPWNDLNARVQSPEGMQLTLSEVQNLD